MKDLEGCRPSGECWKTWLFEVPVAGDVEAQTRLHGSSGLALRSWRRSLAVAECLDRLFGLSGCRAAKRAAGPIVSCSACSRAIALRGVSRWENGASTF